ncbi:hypothetical protein FK531_17800 [Rhodococcus spelaei]|uniref:Uncharacterized protein n=1 Tax=Rhodococcus spelaei TaxID=2546320 RepID=A0A541B205_9NOCA|nr:hypothetical protein [Rhodococcus spelaei]TQF66362.1 hypothetical protein FK531_17800 [Rhodococcus spelaei]
MNAPGITDQQIAAMSAAQRRELIERLERPAADLLPSPGAVARIRRLRLGLIISGSVGLIPWIVFFAVTLPNQYVAHNWPATWVGFDVLLVTMMAATAVLGWQRRLLLVLTGFATGILLICDAWFDIMTADPDDVWVALATAVFFELPLAAILVVGTLRLVHIMAGRLWLLQPGMHLWQVRIPL